ncbi:MAG TPA: hypothetical protein PLV06_02600 [Bacteroidales bacterium]|nr:hypothetical protein [Bacteroidales bacterium]HPR11252.1 hypothetical protein [Bacteroidales bacterium]
MDKKDSVHNTNADEVDLLDLFRQIGKSILRAGNNVGRAVLISVVFLLRNWLPLLASGIIGIGLSYLFKYTSPPLYQSNIVLRTNVGDNSDLIEKISRLHIYTKEKNQQKLQELLSLEGEIIKNIKDIDAFWIIDNNNDGIPDKVDYKRKHNVYDTLNVMMTDRFNVRVKIKDPVYLANVRSGLIRYIRSDSLLYQRNQIRIRQNKELISRIDYDIMLLDSLQKVKYFEETRNRLPKEGGQMIFLQEHSTQLVIDDIYSLYARKQLLETDLNLYKEVVTVLSDFSAPVRRTNGGKYYALRIVPAIFFLTLLLLILLANRKALSGVFDKYK